MDRHIARIKEALEKIDGEYFGIRTTYANSVIRERSFCYEFYHQMRCVFGNENDFLIHGEIDKQGHRDFRKEDRLNPDFVFHLPGTHDKNTVVMEIKGVLRREGVKKDFNTLLTYTQKYRYKLGVFVVFGHSLNELTKHFSKEDLLSGYEEGAAEQVLIMAIKKPRTCVEQCYLSRMAEADYS